MATPKKIVIGASAGGVDALVKLCQHLPADLPAAVLIVLHTPPMAHSFLPEILSRAGKLPAQHAVNEEEIKPGKIYIASPNHHMLIRENRLFLSLGPRENGTRPAVDPLFRTAAQSNGPDVIGVILTGTQGDGSLGMQQIKQAGGITIVQDPDEALFSGMPLNAIEKTEVDYVLPVKEIGAKIVELVNNGKPESERGPMNQNEENREKNLENDRARFMTDDDSSPRTLLTCPDCGGVLWENRDNIVVSYVCQIGHKFSQENIGLAQTNAVETALWNAVRLLEERVAFVARIASRAEEQHQHASARRYREMEEDASRTAAAIRDLISSSSVVTPILPLDD